VEELSRKLREVKKQLLQQAQAGDAAGDASNGRNEQALEDLRKEKDGLWAQLQQDLVSDSHSMRSYLRSAAPALRAAWQARLAKQAQRGILMSAGAQRLLINAFVTLHVLRNHLRCNLPAAIL
jgi:hypothetical protein